MDPPPTYGAPPAPQGYALRQAGAIAPETPVEDSARVARPPAREDEPYSRAALQGILLELNDMLRTLNNAVHALELRVIAIEHAPKPAAEVPGGDPTIQEYLKPDC